MHASLRSHRASLVGAENLNAAAHTPYFRTPTPPQSRSGHEICKDVKKTRAWREYIRIPPRLHGSTFGGRRRSRSLHPGVDGARRCGSLSVSWLFFLSTGEHRRTREVGWNLPNFFSSPAIQSLAGTYKTRVGIRQCQNFRSRYQKRKKNYFIMGVIVCLKIESVVKICPLRRS